MGSGNGKTERGMVHRAVIAHNTNRDRRPKILPRGCPHVVEAAAMPESGQYSRGRSSVTGSEAKECGWAGIVQHSAAARDCTHDCLPEVIPQT